MNTLRQYSAVALPATALIEAAAELETRTHDAEARVEVLERDLQQCQRRQNQTRQLLRAIRHSHRYQSHAATSKLIALALVSLDSPHAVVVAVSGTALPFTRS